MLQNTGNCVGFISEIWEIKPPLCTSLNSLKKKERENQAFTQSPSLGSITATHKLSKLKTKQKKLTRNLFKDKADFFLFCLI